MTLTVTDDDGATDSDSQPVTVSETPQNTPPTAAFAFSCTDLTCTFTDQSTDSDGTIVSWSWSFGDTTGSSAQNPSHTYRLGRHLQRDPDRHRQRRRDRQRHAARHRHRTQQRHHPDRHRLQGAGDPVYRPRVVGRHGANVDVYRNGTPVTTTANDGAYTDNLGRVSGTFVYQVCEQGSSTCSNEVSVVF